MEHNSTSIKEAASRFDKKALYAGLIVALVGAGSFGLGRLSALESQKVPVTISYPELEPASAVSSVPEVKNEITAAQSEKVVASKSGTKYYFPWCATAQRILEANKVWFDSPEAAKKAGYEPAANCKGLR